MLDHVPTDTILKRTNKQSKRMTLEVVKSTQWISQLFDID